MMTNAYDEVYLNDAMNNLGEAFDYAINDCNIDPDEFMNLFISTGVAEEFSNANPKYISGLSGVELVLDILLKSNKETKIKDPRVEYIKTPEFWTGWVLAYYQWKKNRSFKVIHSYESVKRIIELYSPLHEADEEKFVETFDKIIERSNISRLQIQRKRSGLSQKELSDRSLVNIRTLQQYEIKSKDINKASAKVVYSIAKALGCNIEDILE